MSDIHFSILSILLVIDCFNRFRTSLRGVRWFGQHGGKYGHFLPFPDNGLNSKNCLFHCINTRTSLISLYCSLSIKEPFIKYVRKFHNSSIYGKDSRKYAKKKQEVQQQVRNGKSANPNPIESLLTLNVESDLA